MKKTYTVGAEYTRRLSITLEADSIEDARDLVGDIFEDEEFQINICRAFNLENYERTIDYDCDRNSESYEVGLGEEV